MSSFNKVIIVGNVTRDIELKYTKGGDAVCDVGVAINDKRKIGDDWVDEVTYVDVTIWKHTAEAAAKFLTKGSQIMFEGKLKTETWETDGQKRSKLKVSGYNMVFLGSKSDDNSGGQQKTSEPSQGKQESHSGSLTGGADDDIPF